MCVCSLRFDLLLYYFLLFLPSLFLFLILFLTDKKFMANLYNSAKEGVDTTAVLSFPTRFEPKAHDFYELLNSPALLSYTTPTADPDYDDVTLEEVLHQAHRAQVDHSVREDLSVSLSSSSMSDRTGQPVGDRSEQPGEHKSSEAQIRTLLEEQKQKVLAEWQARISQHEFQAARAEEEQRLLQEQLWQQKLEFREARQQSLTEMKNYGNSRVLPSIRSRDENLLRTRTLFWNYQAEYRNCKMK